MRCVFQVAPLAATSVAAVARDAAVTGAALSYRAVTGMTSMFPASRPTLTVIAVVVLAVATAGPIAQTSPFTWEPQSSGVTVRLRGVSAVSSEVAWASGAEGTVLRTTDGGPHVAPAAVPGTTALDFRDVDAVSAVSAHVLSIGPGDASRIYHAEDGGATWTEQYPQRRCRQRSTTR